MTVFMLTLSGVILLSCGTPEDPPPEPQPARPTVTLETSMGPIRIALYPDRAPATVDNFLAYVRAGHYDGTIFHRVITGFMIQGGGFDAGFTRRRVGPPISNEAANGLKNIRGTVAMARTRDPHSATDQFFINTVDNGFLDFRSESVAGWGYAVFGEVVDGMETVDAIAAVPTGVRGRFQDVPITPVVIERAAVLAP